MPGNEVEDGIHNLFEVDNSFQGQYPSHAVNGSWSVLDDNQWAREWRQSVVPLNFNLKSYSLQKLDSLRGSGSESTSVPYKPNCATLTVRPENNRSHSRIHECNTNGSLLGNQSFQTRLNQSGLLGEFSSYDQHNLTLRGLSILKSQQEYESGTDSPTLTANSERSEITEASTDFNFLKGQQQLASDHRPGIPQPGQMQQSGYNDMQLLQQHMMFKQLQELQKQQQLQQLGDVREQNSVNQLSAMSKQAAGGQFSPLNGTPINDASQMFMNWVQCGQSSATQGVANRLVFSPEQGQPLHSMGLVPQPLDVSLYGTPVGTARGNMGQFSHVQGIPQAQKPVVQSSGFSNPLLRNQFTVSPDQVSTPQGAFITSQGFPGKNTFGQVPNQGLNSGILSGNLQEGSSPQINASVKEFNGRQEQTGWPLMQHKTTQQGPSQGLVPLDPMEEKILYNMDDNIWDVSFGRRPDMGAVGFGNTMENTDLSNSFPSLQSGSWSALMQSAVAEASSSDTGLQEEWSGLTFQNTEPSADNQLSNFMESDNQQSGWVDNNLQSASSFSSKPLHMFNDSSMSSSFPGFQQSGIQFSVEHREGIRQDGSHESREKSPKVSGEWLDCDPQQKPSTEGSQQVQSFMHLNNAWAGQIYQHPEGNADQQRLASHTEDSQINFSAAPNTVKAHQATSEQASENNQSDYLGNPNISVDNNEKENMEKISQQISNRPRALSNAYEGESETYEKQESYYQRQNSMGSYNSKGLTGGEQGHSGHLQFFGNSSSNTVNMEQGRLPHFQGNMRASEEVPSRVDLKSGGSDGSNVTAQPSQNMLELLQKVDQSRDDGTAKHFGSADSNSLARLPEAEMHTSGTQNQSSASQGFGLRLAPPSQKPPSSSHFLSSPLTTSYPNSRQVNSELKEKNQTWIASPSSAQTLPPSHELSQRAHWDDKASSMGHTGNSSYLSMQGNSVAAYAPSPSYVRNQSQMQFISSGPTVSQSLQASRYPFFNHAASQDASQQIGSNPLAPQFPVLEAVPISQPSVVSGMSQLGEVSARQHNVWRNVPIQRQPSVPEPPKVPCNSSSAMDPSIINMINAPKVGHRSSDLGAGSQQQIPYENLDTSQAAGLLHGPKPISKHISDTNDLHSGSLVAHSNQQDLHGMKNDNYHSPTASQRNLASVVHSLESSPNQSYSLLDQVQAMRSVETDPSKRLGQQVYEHNFKSRNPMDSGWNSGVEVNSISSRDTKSTTFLTGSTEDPSAKALSRPAFPDRPVDEMVKFGQSDPHSQSGNSNVISNAMEQSQVNLHMAPSWFKQYGTLKNGQMLPMYDARLANMTTGHLFLGKTSQNLHVHASLERVDATASQGGTVLSSTIPNLLGTEHFSASYVLPSDTINPSMAVTKPKKRKHATLERLPWHKEVMEGSARLQNMSMAEEDWVQATNRLIEKVEDGVEMIEDLQPMLRTKRRLILTTQLMQQLLSPAPESILSTDAVSHYDTVTYFISKFALGDACSLTYRTRNGLLFPKNNSKMIPEKLKTFEGTVDQQLSEVVEKLTARAKKLEDDFQGVLKGASMVDIKVECQELERFAVINRFAKFHIRGQADTSGTSSYGTQRPLPQRYVTAVPMPRNLPEGLQCISL
ncbi:hypothetical protein Dsin_017309 [Dipteronia sinensis]|uniref:Dentin sialophosphoprotein-like protein n=1 Tax=Dipteronia sinensis TaxID=43782 RepID=A0AAE0E7S5_9ROSI|nr:hypothetical protein Dsin_017309 [Dipteronia sinensis]